MKKLVIVFAIVLVTAAIVMFRGRGDPEPPRDACEIVVARCNDSHKMIEAELDRCLQRLVISNPGDRPTPATECLVDSNTCSDVLACDLTK